jgi:hypothetical protein
MIKQYSSVFFLSALFFAIQHSMRQQSPKQPFEAIVIGKQIK